MSKAPPSTTSITLDQVNLGLIFISGALAWRWPIETFVLAYAFLGPLHYLTEISWLHNRKYFVPQSFPILPIIFTACAFLLSISSGLMPLAGPIIWLLLLLAIAMVLTGSRTQRLWVIVIAALAPLIFQRGFDFLFLAGVLIPTLIHVYVFTAAFMLFGAIKSRSRVGYVATAALLVVGVLVFAFEPNAHTYVPSNYYRNAIHAFGSFPLILADLVGRNDSWSAQVSVMRFVGFAYLYHYLNWFSKTRVIGWHEISTRRAVAIVILYCGFIAIYAADYVIGFRVAFFLSLAHVLLEFPLNVHSFAGILGKYWKRGQASHAPNFSPTQ